MPHPRVIDDGSTVTLDLHGATLEEATRITLAALRLASDRGRSSVKIIHGSSTSNPLYRNRTIKNELHALLESGRLDPFVTSSWKSENYLLLSLPLSRQANPRPIVLADVLR